MLGTGKYVYIIAKYVLILRSILNTFGCLILRNSELLDYVLASYASYSSEVLYATATFTMRCQYFGQ